MATAQAPQGGPDADTGRETQQARVRGEIDGIPAHPDRAGGMCARGAGEGWSDGGVLDEDLVGVVGGRGVGGGAFSGGRAFAGSGVGEGYFFGIWMGVRSG